jgi:small GTP-binding protein
MTLILIKVGLFGEPNVGKSTIGHYLHTNNISKDKIFTIGVDYCSKEYTVAPNIIVKFQIWDTAGQERYNSIISKYYIVNIPVFIFDVSDENTFNNITKWYNNYLDNCKYDPIKICLIGNKTDLGYNIPMIEISNYSKINNMTYYENSTYHNNKIEEIFENIANEIYKLYKSNKLNMNNITVENETSLGGYFELNDKSNSIQSLRPKYVLTNKKYTECCT